MSLHLMVSQALSDSAQRLNVLALFFAVAGSWLLLATRWREQEARLRLACGTAADSGADAASLPGEPTRRINRFFYQFGFTCLTVALSLSWSSTWI
ncbi:hypothetical protein [Pseudomonas sp. N040]|uniref:hypothetical protein n=1 Tax=Pseudomonas sp. N040 TaxID=2785325 RepID=UPI0018A25FF3|nr:hypothetical protein [Pseudomonas sp. N040]MBF7729609.1 hypothetical protein [Pseudomonas sp. N040]MBW7013249.1 hypothetical protein [Pseudomonas sp. N040]